MSENCPDCKMVLNFCVHINNMGKNNFFVFHGRCTLYVTFLGIEATLEGLLMNLLKLIILWEVRWPHG